MPSVALFEQASKDELRTTIFPCSAIKFCQIRPNNDLSGQSEMAMRIKEAIKTAHSVEELVEAVAASVIPRRVSRRLLTYILVQARKRLARSYHVLGFTEKGRQHLKSLKSRSI